MHRLLQRTSTRPKTVERFPAVRASWSRLLCPLVAVLAVGSSQALAAPADRKVVGELQKGGYVLFVRHFETNPDQVDSNPLHPEKGGAQRQLTENGREQATAFGQALRSLGIPVGAVVCSQFQRAHESAKLIAAGEPVASPDVSQSRSAGSEEETRRRGEALRRLLSTPPEPGKNNLIVSHRPNLLDAAGDEFVNVGEGEVVVFQPTADGKFRRVARIYPPAVWTEWSKAPQK